MPTLLEGVNSGKLSQESEFEEIAQAAIETYYLIPYPGKEDRRPTTVNRKLHGGVHVASVAHNVELFIELYKKYNKKLLINQNGEPFTEQDVKLLKLSAIYHDSANKSEIIGIEKEHADNFRRDMLLLGFTAEVIEPFALAIQEKDGALGKHGPASALN